MKKCKSGYYYCNTDKKCKPIPRGYRVGYGGYLRKEKDDDDSKTKSNGNGNGNGNGSHGNGNGGNGSNGGGNGGGMGESVIHETDFHLNDLTKPNKEYDLTNARERMIYNRLKKAGKNPLIKKVTEALNSKDKPAIKELINKLKGSAKAHKQQSKDLEVALKTEGSLHKWFKGSKSKDGKGGWVNVVTGGTCASDEPGEGTPKCVSSSKRASMSKSERLSAARRKKKADPGQQSKSGAAKPTYVSTDSPRKKKKMKEEIIISEEGKSVFSTPSLDKLKKIKDYKNNADKVFGRKPIEKAHYEPEGEIISEVKDKKGKGSGSKDACYHKVKSRYSVWPSAYASGALVKCRKVGAANWGNSKKEEFEIEAVDGKFMPSNPQYKGVGATSKSNPVPDQRKSTLIVKQSSKAPLDKKKVSDYVKKNLPYYDSRGANTLAITNSGKIHNLTKFVRGEEFDPSGLSFQQFMEKCWKGYEKKGMKTMFGKRYPNCVKKEETVIEHHQKDENGKVIEHDLPPRPEEEVAQDLAPSSVEEGAAWTKKSGKNPSGGLNEKGRKSYERENPGSDLKRPSKKVGNKRRASFCARMRGMKKKLTSAKTARDPDSRINKSLRAWNC